MSGQILQRPTPRKQYGRKISKTPLPVDEKVTNQTSKESSKLFLHERLWKNTQRLEDEYRAKIHRRWRLRTNNLVYGEISTDPEPETKLLVTENNFKGHGISKSISEMRTKIEKVTLPLIMETMKAENELAASRQEMKQYFRVKEGDQVSTEMITTGELRGKLKSDHKFFAKGTHQFERRNSPYFNFPPRFFYVPWTPPKNKRRRREPYSPSSPEKIYLDPVLGDLEGQLEFTKGLRYKLMQKKGVEVMERDLKEGSNSPSLLPTLPSPTKSLDSYEKVQRKLFYSHSKNPSRKGHPDSSQRVSTDASFSSILLHTRLI